MDDNVSSNCLQKLFADNFEFVMSCDLLIFVLNLFMSI